ERGMGAVVGGVERPAEEPAVEGRVAAIEHLVPAAAPLDALRRLTPEAFRIGERTAVDLVETTHDAPPRAFRWPSADSGRATSDGQAGRGVPSPRTAAPPARNP